MLFLKSYSLTYYINFCAVTAMLLIMAKLSVISISHLTRKRVECKPSAISDHPLLYNHDSDFKDFTIACRDNNGFDFY